MAGRESKFETKLVNTLETDLFPGSIVLKIYPFIQGTPDRIMLWENTWAAFEVKRSGIATLRPNQRHYIQLLNKMSFAQIVYPEREQEFLNAIQRALSFKK